VNPKKVEHIAMDQFETHHNELYMAGKSIREIANIAGDTPFYAYDATVIDKQLRRLRQHLPDAVKVHYAIKANPFPLLVRYMAQQVDGFDVASVSEMLLALQSGMSAHRISIAGPAKKYGELSNIIEAGCCINLESAAELQRAMDAAEQAQRQPRLALRINPDFELKSSGMKMGGGAKPFGIDAEKVPQLLRQMDHLDIDFQGFHIFSGSQNLNADAIIDAHNQTVQLAINLAQHSKRDIPRINIGGGFGIPYFPGDQRLNIRPIGENLQLLAQRVRAELGHCEIILELGRYLVGECGVYVAMVVEKKISRGQTFLVTDGGLHHHLAASGNFGQVIRKNYPLAIANRMQCQEKQPCHVVGPLCTPLDILGQNVSLCDADSGDLVAVYQSGAYAYSASPTAFLGHPPAREIFLVPESHG